MAKPNTNTATDWTGLLADPDLSRNLGKLLQTYREAPPERRDQALLEAMKEIKKNCSDAKSPSISQANTLSPVAPAAAAPAPATSVPPFEPGDIFTPTWEDRRRHKRIKCFVAVELRVNEADKPIWGNLSNTSLGGCQVETAEQISNGSNVEIGLWVASGKIWVKGLALNGVVSRSATGSGVRIKFSAMEAASKENLRQFLKYIQETTKAAKNETTYMQLLK
jgi:hypothetical protein